MALIDDVLSGTLNKGNAIQTITIESRWLPPIVIDKPLEDTGAPPNPLWAFFRPKIVVQTGFRSAPYAKAPWGEPGTNYWPQVKIGLILGGLILGGMVWAKLAGRK